MPLQAGDRVRIAGRGGKGSTGTLVRQIEPSAQFRWMITGKTESRAAGRVEDQRHTSRQWRWLVRLDKPSWGRTTAAVLPRNLVFLGNEQLHSGQRVVVTNDLLLYGRTGTLVRPARLWWNKNTWLVELDGHRKGAIKRTRIAASSLAALN